MLSTKRKTTTTADKAEPVKAETTKVKVSTIDRLTAEMKKLASRLIDQKNKVKAEIGRLFKVETTTMFQSTRQMRAKLERGFKNIDTKKSMIATRNQYDTEGAPAFFLSFGDEDTFTPDQPISDLTTILVSGSKVNDPVLIDPDQEPFIHAYCQFLLEHFLRGWHAKLSAVFDDLIALDDLLDQEYNVDMEESE